MRRNNVKSKVPIVGGKGKLGQCLHVHEIHFFFKESYFSSFFQLILSTN